MKHLLFLGVLGFGGVALAASHTGESANDYDDEEGYSSSASAPSSMDQQDFERRVQDYFNGIKTLRAHYSQTNPDGSRVSGRFYLMRSNGGYGKMRLEDKNQRIISNGNELIHTDLKTNESNSYPIGSTPAAFLLEPTLTLDDYTIKNFSPKGDQVSLTLAKKGDEESYQLSIIFKTKPFLMISEWVVVDGQGNRTHVRLSNVEIGVSIDPDLFKS